MNESDNRTGSSEIKRERLFTIRLAQGFLSLVYIPDNAEKCRVRVTRNNCFLSTPCLPSSFRKPFLLVLSVSFPSETQRTCTCAVRVRHPQRGAGGGPHGRGHCSACGVLALCGHRRTPRLLGTTGLLTGVWRTPPQGAAAAPRFAGSIWLPTPTSHFPDCKTTRFNNTIYCSGLSKMLI